MLSLHKDIHNASVHSFMYCAKISISTACSLEIKTRSREDNCMTEFMKVEFINVNDKKNWHLRVEIIL